MLVNVYNLQMNRSQLCSINEPIAGKVVHFKCTLSGCEIDQFAQLSKRATTVQITLHERPAGQGRVLSYVTQPLVVTGLVIS